MVQRTAFAKSKLGLEYSLVIDATGKTAAEVHEMHPDNRLLTALLRARFYREQNEGTKNQGGRR